MQWISVKDEIPKIGYDVLVYLSSNEISIGFRNLDGDWKCTDTIEPTYDYSGTRFYDGSITHWMALPEPPKE
jgi:hypothetical protein